MTRGAPLRVASLFKALCECVREHVHTFTCVSTASLTIGVFVCVCVYEDINLYNDTGMTGITSRR